MSLGPFLSPSDVERCRRSSCGRLRQTQIRGTAPVPASRAADLLRSAYEPRRRQLDGVLAGQDRANDLGREIGETDKHGQIIALHAEPRAPWRRCCRHGPREACFAIAKRSGESARQGLVDLRVAAPLPMTRRYALCRRGEGFAVDRQDNRFKTGLLLATFACSPLAIFARFNWISIRSVSDYLARQSSADEDSQSRSAGCSESSAPQGVGDRSTELRRVQDIKIERREGVADFRLDAKNERRRSSTSASMSPAGMRQPLGARRGCR